MSRFAIARLQTDAFALSRLRDSDKGILMDELVLGASPEMVHLEVLHDDLLWMDLCGVHVHVDYAARTVSFRREEDDGFEVVQS